MRVCVVGNGPSAQGKGEIIDAADFVVRIKAFWCHGAEDAGSKIDALAWYGFPGGWELRPELDGVSGGNTFPIQPLEPVADDLVVVPTLHLVESAV